MEWLKYLTVRNDGIGILINGWKQGSGYEKLSNKQLEYELNYVNDEPHGIQYGWYGNGNLLFISHYIGGKVHGIQCSWYENGQLYYNDDTLPALKGRGF